MRRMFGASVIVAAILFPALAAAQPVAGQQPAAAQTVDDQVPAGPIINSWYAGVNTGVSVVEKFSGAVGVEAGMRLWRNLDGVAEFFWTPNAVTSGQLGRINTLADTLDAYGDGAGSLKVPTAYYGVGGRWVFENSGRYRPYVLVTIGAARTNLKPTLTLDGQNVVDSAGDYGITLGDDVIGAHARFATEGGIGIVMAYGDTWYFDAGARLMSISGNEERTNVARLVIGGGYRF